MWLTRLKQLKAKSGKTTKDLASLSGIPEPTLEKIFSGATKDPKLETIRTLVHSMGYTLDDLDPKEGIKKEAPNDDRSEPPVSIDTVADALQQLGIIKPGEDLSDSDLRYLSSVVASLRNWFDAK